MPAVSGWKEIISLNQLGLPRLVAKIDTGARSAALHASDILPYNTETGDRVAFTLFPHRGLRGCGVRCTAPLVDRREVTNSGGEVQIRYVIETEICLADQRWSIEITLTDRTRMRYPMLIGRAALEGRFIVDPSRSYLLTKRKRNTR